MVAISGSIFVCAASYFRLTASKICVRMVAPIPERLLCITCLVSPVTCHLSLVTCHLTTTLCSLSCHESSRSFGDAAPGGLVVNKQIIPLLAAKVGIICQFFLDQFKECPLRPKSQFHSVSEPGGREGSDMQTERQIYKIIEGNSLWADAVKTGINK